MKDMEEIMMAWNEFNGIGTKVKIYELPLWLPEHRLMGISYRWGV